MPSLENNADSKPHYKCSYCNHEYRTHHKYEEHVVFCEFSHKTKQEQENDIEMYDTLPTQKHLFLILKQLSLRVSKLERENALLRNFASKLNRKINVLEWLNNREHKPIKTWKEWIVDFDYENAMDIIFEKDIPSAVISSFETGGELAIQDVENIPIRVFLQKKNIFYVYGKERSSDDEPKWYILTDEKFDNWIDYIVTRFIMLFPVWFENLLEKNPKHAAEIEEQKNAYYQKLLGVKITEESRNQRVRHSIYKILQKHSKMVAEYDMQII